MTFRTGLFLALSLATPSIRPSFYDNSLSFAATVAGTVIVSKFAYDAVSLFDTYKLPELCNKLFVKQPVLASDPSIKVALVTIEGDIYDVRNYLKKFEECTKDDSIKAVVIHISSGGGGAGPSELLFREISNLKKIKPVIVIVDNYCCSGAYWAAVASDYIIATSTATVGHIGVWRMFKHFTEIPKGTMDKEEGKIESEFIKAGKYKISGNLYQGLTEDEKKHFQDMINKIYDIFCHNVADARNLSFDERDIWANGKELIAEDALKLGLIDECGSWTDAQQKALELIKKKDPNADGPLKIVAL